MAWSRTLAQLVSDVALRCDVDGYTARHPTANIRRLIIESYQRLRDWMTSRGSQRWIVGPVQLGGVTGVEQLTYATKVPLTNSGGTANYERLSLVEVLVNGHWHELRAVSIGELKDYYSTLNGNGIPQAWTYEANAAEPTAAGPAFCILVAPSFDPASMAIRVYGMAETNITDADATVLYLDAPGFEWVIWDAVIKISARDNDSTGTFAVANQERSKQEAQIIESIRGEQRGSRQRRDVFHGLNRFKESRRY